jgi:hypothetical protein
MEPRVKDRRTYKKIPDFPFLTNNGVAYRERRRYIDRRDWNRQIVWFKA